MKSLRSREGTCMARQVDNTCRQRERTQPIQERTVREGGCGHCSGSLESAPRSGTDKGEVTGSGRCLRTRLPITGDDSRTFGDKAGEEDVAAALGEAGKLDAAEGKEEGARGVWAGGLEERSCCCETLT